MMMGINLLMSDPSPPLRGAAPASTAKVLSSAANGIADFIVANGADPEAVLRAVGIDESTVRTDRESLDLHRYCDLIETAARQTNNANFGLQFGRDFVP